MPRPTSRDSDLISLGECPGIGIFNVCPGLRNTELDKAGYGPIIFVFTVRNTASGPS